MRYFLQVQKLFKISFIITHPSLGDGSPKLLTCREPDKYKVTKQFLFLGRKVCFCIFQAAPLVWYSSRISEWFSAVLTDYMCLKLNCLTSPENILLLQFPYDSLCLREQLFKMEDFNLGRNLYTKILVVLCLLYSWLRKN